MRKSQSKIIKKKSFAYRAWGLAKRSEHRRIKGKQKKK